MDSKNLIHNIQEWLHLKNKASAEGSNEPPLPAELFNADQMERHGITLVLSHKIASTFAPDMLLKRLSECEAIITDACDQLEKDISDSYSPAREWLLDNDYLIEEEIYAIRRNLPKGYGKSLPQLAGGVPGYPRVYDIALEIIKHGDGHWDIDNLSRFIATYQQFSQLTLGELWAIPIMLGIALIENLSNTSQLVVADSNDHKLAAQWAERMIEVAVSEPKQLVMVIGEMARSEPVMNNGFIAELARRLQGAAIALPLSWIEQHLSEDGLSIEQVVQEENKFQAATQVTISNCITSLRKLSEVDWRDFVEAMSVVEKILRMDPADIYSKMDFMTRDNYRHVIERLSRMSKFSEASVAENAILLAKAQLNNVPAAEHANIEIVRHSHVGFFLIEEGLLQLESKLGMCRSWLQRMRDFAGKHALKVYLGSIMLITVVLLYFILNKAVHYHLGFGWLIIMAATSIIALSQLALALVNLAAAIAIKPQALPRMDFSNGIPAELSTVVVVPAMLFSKENIELLIETLEVRFLGNRDQHIYFMLLTDFSDAPSENMPEDVDLLTLAEERINALNKTYADKDHDIFFLCHRPRLWNPQENIWMGKERKRGKLNDLNNLLRSDTRNSFLLIVGRIEILKGIKYVITLDSDTQLPRETARQYVGAMAHPLNRPRIDTEKQCVVEGYGILQPRIAEALPLGGLTRYIQLCGNEFGVDPYTRSVSNIYQDIFEEGSFIGKGIYDVDVVIQILGQRFPDNTILSHDLLEGCFVRSGLISDIPLYEQSPSNYLTDVKRRVRWIRGDWQIAGWLRSKVLNQNNEWVVNPLSALSKFKIFDNLRRSLVPISLMVLFILSWLVLQAPCFWVGIIFVIIIFPALVQTLLELIHKPKDMLPRQHIANIMHAAYRCAGQLILYIACLPHEAWYSMRAIVITLWRMKISKKYLLEWTPCDQVNKGFHNTVTEWLANLWVGPVTAVIIFMCLTRVRQVEALQCGLLILLLWFFSPFIARWLSCSIKRRISTINAEQRKFLHKMARKTWHYYDTFMTTEDNWLPPDNYQETPVTVLARRTSPTNIGLTLLSNLTAYDFAYINMKQLLERTTLTLQTMMKMERYRGHLYNWYDTATLAPLFPRYISTVDSGNLSAHLLTLRQGLFALINDPLVNANWKQGLEDTLEWIKSASENKLPAEFSRFQELLRKMPATFIQWQTALDCTHQLCAAAKKINSTSEYNNKLVLQCQALHDEINLFSALPGLLITATLNDAVLAGSEEARTRVNIINELAQQAFSLSQMDMSFLYDNNSHLLTIGFNVDTQLSDSSRYDLLSSEARLGCYVAISLGQMLQESWFALGRLLVSSGGEPVLISWSGSMFEYLMPILVMPTYEDTLLDQTYHAAVRRQIAYGKHRGLPWGVSESGYYAVDNQYNYLYRAFGVPALGLKRGLEDDMVIAPYASAMALMIEPDLACQNLQRLENDNAVGKYGFYEAIDYTESRLPRDTKRALVQSFMTHHQGMTFLSFSYLLHNKPMQQRFLAEPLFQSTLLLLQERIPKPTANYLHIPLAVNESVRAQHHEASMRIFTSPYTRTPQVQLLSNGHYHTVLTQAGGGYSRWNDLAVTRWREDSTCDNWGLFSYVCDVASGEFWSTNYQPTLGSVENYKAVFSEAHAEFDRQINNLAIHTEIVVSPEDDIELRRFNIHNHSKTRRVIEFTSYAEIVLAPQTADISQPAFSNLFIETELLPEKQAILATRRPADISQNSPWLCHLLNVYTDQQLTISFETDRAQFVGRDRTPAAPLAMIKPGELSNTSGAVLDPIVAIRCRVTLAPNESIVFDLITGVSESRDVSIKLIEKYHDRNLTNRIFGLAWTHGQVLLHHLNIVPANAPLYGRMAGAIIYASNTRRADVNTLSNNHLGQPALWKYAISGDLPIVLLQIESSDNIELVQQLVQAQAYWRHNGLYVDLVILNEELTSYRQSLQDMLMNFVSSNNTADHAGTIKVLGAEHIPTEDMILLQSVARVIISDQRGTLKEQLGRRRVAPPVVPLLSVHKGSRRQVTNTLPVLPQDMQFYNDLGGYTKAGDEYIIRLAAGAHTPAPWANVLANPNFGTIVTESGQGYSWIENSHEFRLTPWDNDPLQDTSGEAYYLRDDETGKVWSPSALPCPGSGDYQTRHGFGYSVFEHAEDGIHSEMWVYVAHDAPIKYVVIKVRNDSSRQRQLSVAGYAAWVLGDLRNKNAMYVVTELSSSGTLLAQNRYNTDFGERTAFFDAATANLNLTARSVTGDRAEFIGRNSSLSQPAALKRKHLSNRVGAGLDPCGAIQLAFNLDAGQSREIVFTLGAGQNKQDANVLAKRYNDVAAAKVVLTALREFWQRTLGIVHVNTPDPAVNLLANGWLLYQVLSSRLWGRTGYYQSSGAFGFRDQLQDALSLTHVAPELLRTQILLCAGHQFEEGDVQHWWHPPSNRGVRTRCSDDYLWLPFAICHYIECTGDEAIFDEVIPFLQGRLLKANEESYYESPVIGNVAVKLYEHAVRAINNGLKYGVHGLPLMGSGDWNDGMNMVGKDGKGESVWLAFFLFSVLKKFAPLAKLRDDPEFAAKCESESKKLQQAIEENAWDGAWYKRAYFDDGTPLGSNVNSECKIDSIAQSWAVLSGAAEPARAKEAMASLNQHLVSETDGLVKLLDPPFDKFKPNPGYIEGYVPGIRENGGQYTHGAVWAALAFAKLNDKERAWKVLEILNPINHGKTAAQVARYKIEPYVVAGDVYSTAPHIGHGGWSWYTGSAGWLYRLVIESLLGVQLEAGNRLRLSPLLPDAWDGFQVDYHHGKSLYQISVKRTTEKASLTLDDIVQNENVFALSDDGKTHQVVLQIL